MEASLRIATKADLPSILRLNNDLCSNEHQLYDRTINPRFATTKAGRAYFIKRIQSRARSVIFVIQKEEKIVGYLCGHISASEVYRQNFLLAEIENMAIEEKFRRKGFGKLLYQAFIGWARKRKAKKIKVVSSAENRIANKFYRELGFQPLAITLEQAL